MPKTTTPLTKFIRTTEGWLVAAANIALLITPIVTDSVSGSLALKLAVILNGVTVISRSVLKAVAALSPVVGDPITPAGINYPQVPPGA